MRTPEMTERLVERRRASFDLYATTEDCGASNASATKASTSSRTWRSSRTSTRKGARCPRRARRAAARHQPPQPGAADHPAGGYGRLHDRPEPCRCGRTLVRARAIEGRSDDVLKLGAGRPQDQGAPHRVRDRDARPRGARVPGPPGRAVFAYPRRAALECGRRARGGCVARCRGDSRSSGSRNAVAVERRELARSAGGKLQMVVADPVAREKSLN